MATKILQRALLVVAVAAMVSGPATAQTDEDLQAEGCLEVCLEQKKLCDERCAEWPNPIDCESDCNEAHESCTDRCD